MSYEYNKQQKYTKFYTYYYNILYDPKMIK